MKKCLGISISLLLVIASAAKALVLPRPRPEAIYYTSPKVVATFTNGHDLMAVAYSYSEPVSVAHSRERIVILARTARLPHATFEFYPKDINASDGWSLSQNFKLIEAKFVKDDKGGENPTVVFQNAHGQKLESKNMTTDPFTAIPATSTGSCASTINP